MSDELDEITGTGLNDDDTEESTEAGDVDPADIDPSSIIDEEDPEALDESLETPIDGEAVSPEDDPFGFGAFGEEDENGEFRSFDDEEDEPEDEISPDLF